MRLKKLSIIIYNLRIFNSLINSNINILKVRHNIFLIIYTIFMSYNLKENLFLGSSNFLFLNETEDKLKKIEEDTQKINLNK